MDEISLTDISCLRDLMSRHGIVAKKKYGQNFLIKQSVPERIAVEGCKGENCGVLEIGPGMGVLTRELCKRARKVVALEIDASLLPVLDETLSDFDNVEIVLKDVMKTDLPALCKEAFTDCDRICVCANLPYYITSPVLMHVLESGAAFSSVTVMVQKEVADRITAKAGSADYGAITAAVAYYGKASKLFPVSAGCFYPAPKVDSAVLRIDLYEDNPYKDCDRELLFKMISRAFEQRRKTLMNTLKGAFTEEEREAVRSELARMGFPEDVRGERLSLDDFARLARAVRLLRTENERENAGAEREVGRKS